MQAFGYYDPTSAAKAAAIASDKPEGRYLAGGQSLLAAMKLSLTQPTDLIDLARVPELHGIRADAKAVTLGAMVRHAEVAASPEVAARIPALAALAGLIGDRQVRNRGTLGGSLANNDPAADYPAAVLGLKATIHTSQRAIDADQYFTGLFETALTRGEIITRLSFPIPKRSGYAKLHQPASRFALVGVFVAELADGSIRVAVTGAGPCAFRAAAIEAALKGSFTAAAAESAKISADNLNADLHGSPEYRAHMVPVLAGRAVASAR